MGPFESNNCRICLKTNDLADIFADDATTTVAEKIMYCASIQVLPEDSLPSKICKQCINYLNVAYVFRLVCEWTDSRLQTKKCAPESTATDDVQNMFSKCSQSQKQSVHPIEVLLKHENLISSRLFDSVSNENVNELKLQAPNGLRKPKNKTEESDKSALEYALTFNINKTEFLKQAYDEAVSVNKINKVDFNELEVEKYQLMYEETETFTEKNNVPDIKKVESANNSIILNKMVDSGKETNLNCTNDSSVDKDDFIIEEEILLNEESLLAYGTEHFLIEDNCLISEDNLITELHCKEVNDLSVINYEHTSVDNAKIIAVETENEINFVNKYENNKKYKFRENDTHNFVVENSLLFECNKPVYSEICLNYKDPLLLNTISKSTLNENDTNLINSASNEDLSGNFKAAENSTPQAKHIDLANISLDDFETFQKDLNVAEKQSNNDVLENINNKNTKENRVGRHIAKKNAGQPPKRYYGPTSQNPKQTINGKSAIAMAKDSKSNEADEKIETQTDLINVDSTLDQVYILESDLSMPEPIFEETIITDSFYYTNDNEEYLAGNFDDNGTNTILPQLKQKARSVYNKNRTKKKQTQYISSTDQTTEQSGNNDYEIQQNSNSKCSLNDSDDNSEDSNFADESVKNSNGSKTEYYDDDDDDPNYSDFTDSSDDEYTKPQHTTSKNKPTNKKSKSRRKLSNTTCKLCNKSFPFPSHLQRHLTAHIGIKRFTCKYCNKQFLHRYNLSVHMRSHTGNFPLRCNICNRGFASPSVLERHKRSHTGETPFQCQYCLQLFTHASSLSMHEKMHLNRPSFKCDICFKAFSYKSSLTAHTKGHLGFKQHSCNVCHKMFTRRTSVMRHMLCHSEFKKFKCPTCGDVVNSKSNLVKHHKMHSDS